MRASLAVASKDLKVELRSRNLLNSIVPFAGSLLIIFGLAFGPDRASLLRAAPALLWLAVLLSGVLAVGRSFDMEAEDGAYEGLVLAPIDKVHVFLGKLVSVSLQLLLLEAISLLGVAFLFGADIGSEVPILAAAFLLGTLGLAGIGVVFAALTVQARAREILVPLLVLPLVIPVLIAGIRATELALSGRSALAGDSIGILAAFAVISVAVGTLVFDQLIEE